jgi:hypothetical protein
MTNAQQATLGAIGEKRGSEFDGKMNPNLNGVPVRLAAKYAKESDKNFQGQADAAAKYAQANGSVHADVIKSSLISGNYEITSVGDISVLIKDLNRQPDAMQWLKNKDARIITGVVVVYSDSEKRVKKFDVSASGSVSGKIIGSDTDPKLSLSTTAGDTETLKISDGFIVAYEMSRPVFDASGTLVNLEIDR